LRSLDEGVKILTIVAIWREEGFLWSVADTRICSPGDQGVVVLTDSGAKLLALPTVCRRIPSTTDEIGGVNPHFATEFGFAFAGASLPALMTYATVATFLQNLATPKKEAPPRMSEVAELVRRVAQRFSDEVRLGRNSGASQFESAVFGWCHTEARFQIFRIGGDSGELKIQEFNPTSEDEIVLLGSGQDEFRRKIHQFKNDGEPHGRTGRWPKLVVESMALEGMGSVGGSLSIGITRKTGGYELFFWVRPREYGKSPAYFSFNGLEIEKDVGRVGRYIINMAGMV